MAFEGWSEGRRGWGREPGEGPRMWHVTVTVAGAAVEPDEVRMALERLADERPFMLSARYAADRAEIHYWEEAADVHDAAALALRLWGEHRRTSGLPPWEIVGLEVIDRETFQRRGPGVGAVPPLGAAGVRPF